jgi:glutamate dehydrogenase (NAD(P)+)
MKCIGVGDHTGYYFCEEGFNVLKLNTYNKKNRSLQNYPIGTSISVEEFFSLSCDILIPAALELQIDVEVATNLNCKMIVEGANGPTTFEAEKIILEKQIDLIPDILANSGGVIVSYYEWLQNKQRTIFDPKYINEEHDAKMIETFNSVYNISTNRNISMRIAS